MAQQGALPVAYGSFHAMTDHASADHHYLESFNDWNSASYGDDCVITIASGSANLSSSSWRHEAKHHAIESSLSSLSDSTPAYPDNDLISHLPSQPQLLAPDFWSSNPLFIYESQQNWPQHSTMSEACTPLPGPTMRCESDCGEQSLPARECYVHPNATSTSLQHLVGCDTVYKPSNLAPSKSLDQDDSASIGSSASVKSDHFKCVEDDSSDDHKAGSCSRLISIHETSSTVSVVKRGKCSTCVSSVTRPEQRHHSCPLFEPRDTSGRPCEKRFTRPEHLYRHLRTVHGTHRHFRCKVPGCEKAFSRGDNMRDHYWTHLDKGGRAGKNAKMSLKELVDILGPEEKRLATKLKQRLKSHDGGHGATF